MTEWVLLGYFHVYISDLLPTRDCVSYNQGQNLVHPGTSLHLLVQEPITRAVHGWDSNWVT
jgi:hypothetical protein